MNKYQPSIINQKSIKYKRNNNRDKNHRNDFWEIITMININVIKIV